MARQSNSDQLAEIHRQALEEFDRVWAAQRGERLQALEDRRFYSISGAQWEGALGEQFENKPRFEFNRVHLAVIRVVNEYRNNRITVDFTPRDGSPDEDDLADTCDGLHRADERACSANEAYDTAYEEGVSGGMGAWRLRAVYEDEDDDEDDRQRIAIEPIFDADSCVFFNLDAKRQDKSDAKRCWVLTPYTHDAFKDEFGHDPADWPKETLSGRTFDWITPDIVWVCEHYRIEERHELVHFFKGLDDSEMRVSAAELKEDPAMLSQLLATGFRMVREKRLSRHVVRKYLLSGSQVEDDCGPVPGKYIPIIPFFGKRWVVDGVERFMGHVRLAKDAQRLSNMLMSWLAEMAARFDIEKPILTPQQIAGYATLWAEDNVEKYPYLLINPVTDATGAQVNAGPVGYTRAPNIPPAMAALAQLAEQALQDLLGNQQAGEELQPNISGKAVELIQTRLDMQVFIYMSNFAKAMKRSGEVWLAMKREITVEESRRMKVIASDGKPGSVLVNEPAYDPEKGATIVKNDITKATFEVDVDVGPTSSSKRAATVRALTGLQTITDDPETKQALTLATVANIEGEGLGDLNDWARMKAIRLGTVKPNEEEKAQMQQEAANAKPNAQDQYLQAAAEQATADAALKRAGTVEKVASADLKKAQTAETWAKALGEKQAQEIASFDTLRGLLAPPPVQPMQ